ncbi:ATP-binding cassette, subfamily B [Treponema bryantii]|uniref:ATP-binding cassette, subfamily B n=1 Tax=Treponema bryantii TaxID=163 RepID=A0A1I3JTN0_9SPIR|nr:ABC transporter ATP-binding protein [Treponema bryantii]SFI63629.1 ATP-binding cassette, subfamily B [Treponema bryantii]
MPPVRNKGFGKPKDAKKTIGRILQYMGKFKALWLVVFLCVIVSSGASVIGTYLIKPALNNYIIPLIGKQNPDFTGFAKLLIGVLALFCVGVLASWCNSRLMLYISTNLLYNVRCDLFSRLEKLPIKYYDAHTHGELMSRFTNDTDALREMMSQTIPQLFSSIITVTSVFVMMISLSPMLTIIMLVTMFLITLSMAAVGKRSAKAFRENQKCVGELNGFIEEMVEGQKVIKVFNHEPKAIEQFETLSDNLRKAGTDAMTYGGLMGPMMNNFSHMQYAVVAITAAAFMILGEGGVMSFNWFTGIMNLGTIAAFLQYTRSFSQPISMMSMQANSVLNALAGAERIFAVIDEEEEIDEGEYTLVNAYEAKESDGEEKLVQSYATTGEWAWKNPADNSLRKLEGEVVFDHVTFGYKPEKTVLHDICIHAKPGQKIALVGSTGSGKTTTINLLSRFYDVPEGSGKITYDGIPLNEISKASLRKSLGMVQQTTHLFTGTIKDNIRYGNLEASDAQIYEAAKLANADHFIRHLENGYDTVITGDGASLSQGQRQLLAIARAAVADPPVLVLDEATSSIDTRTEKLIEEGMDSLMSGRTTFVIAHRLSTVRNADEIIVLEHGNIIERGTHDELIAAKGRYYFLYTGNKITLDE